MIMPFARLIAIYLIVGLAIFAFFKRDAIVSLINGPEVQTVNVADLISTQAAQNTAPVAKITPETAPEPAALPPLTVPTPPTDETEAADEGAEETVVEHAQAPNMQTRLIQARNVFWSGDRQKAEALYTSLAADFPDDITIAGELGNIYYNSNRRALAATQFHTVGVLALKAGNTAQAMTMIGVLQTIAPDLAADLRAKAQN